MKKTFLEWVAYCLLFIWQLPQNIVGLFTMLYFLIVGKVRKIDETKWSAAYESTKMLGGISLGCFCFVSDLSSKRKEYVAHELKGHTVDSRIMGPFYLLIIGLPSLLNAMFGFTKCYYDFYTEVRSNRHAGLGVDENCRLYFLNDKEK